MDNDEVKFFINKYLLISVKEVCYLLEGFIILYFVNDVIDKMLLFVVYFLLLWI